ncbi:ParA family protein [Treponema sp. Marseille-Q4523]|uniref:ParA family protein n=1 Tax=Treponema sp. Marseille-Q4523 TaxID=2810610 RepID=UPI001960540B|nr:ParA family protein [Treponema sp. Marseille-Q4523]MBM7022675.1 ParA family protein [Treponema sp. Marseille-Q4523]
MFVIVYASAKGGVGKTTGSILTATNLAARGYKVGYFDLDPNNSGTMFFTTGIEGIEEIIESHNVFEALSHNNIMDYVIATRIENIDIVPSHLNIFKLRGIGYNELQKTLKSRDLPYDYIVVDTAPTYDNIVINALNAADIILTPLEFSSFNFTTTKFLQRQLYDDCPQQVNKWYLLYSHWQEKLAPFEFSQQSQFVKVFESEFQNILDIHIPHTSAANNYTQTDTKISINSPIVGSKRLAIEMNKLVNMITGKENNVEKF